MMKSILAQRQSDQQDRRFFLKTVPFLCLGLGAGLSACQTPPPMPSFAPIRFNHLPAFRLNVALIDAISEFRPPQDRQFVQEDFPIPPGVAAMQWVQDRLSHAGSAGSATAILTEASVREVPLPVKKGLEGVFTTDQSERYEAILSMRLEVTRPDNSLGAVVTATAKRSRTVAEDVSLNERHVIWHTLTQQLMQDFNTEMERQMRSPAMQPFLLG